MGKRGRGEPCWELGEAVSLHCWLRALLREPDGELTRRGVGGGIHEAVGSLPTGKHTGCVL